MTTSSITSTVSQSRITRDTQQVFQKWGSGIDGNINIATSTTLSTDKAYENLNIATGVTLNTNGYVLRVRNRLNLFGTISNSASGTTPGGKGTVGGGGSGGGTVSLSLGGAGSGNTVTPPDAGVDAILKDTNINNPRIFDLINNGSMFAGGSGGGIAQGAGGGIVVVLANTITGNGSIKADGSNGAPNGGGGGAVLVYTTSPQGSITLTANGGTAGGSNGNTSWLQV